jgi:hypothetical protein
VKEARSMGTLQEKEIRGYQLKSKIVVCPVCASEEEMKGTEQRAITEDDIARDPNRMVCDRCKSKL